MTREEASNQINDMKTELAEHLLKKDIEALDMAISALSTEGEYIKKSELLQHVTTEELSDFKDCDVIHADEIDDLPTYSFPDSAEDNTMEWKASLCGYECSKCNKQVKLVYNFCPNCGRKAVSE